MMTCEVNAAGHIAGSRLRHCRRCKRLVCIGCSTLVTRLVWASNGGCMFSTRRPVRECTDCAAMAEESDTP